MRLSEWMCGCELLYHVAILVVLDDGEQLCISSACRPPARLQVL